MSLAFVFPGQGSQSVGMLRDYGNHAVVRATIDEASASLDQDLWSLIDNGPETDLNQTANTQPVMLAADVAVFSDWPRVLWLTRRSMYVDRVSLRSSSTAWISSAAPETMSPE